MRYSAMSLLQNDNELSSEGRSSFKLLTGKPTRNIPLGRPSVDGRTILEWTLNKKVSIQGSAQDRDYWKALYECEVRHGVS